uniref:Forkhead box protein O3B-like n=1 Tax=Camelus bactrianus TaxID=9837 RepID=A0A9W3HD10_CAMBA|nr:forkhead box protein O3B-like [Camelus bactrianus]
MHLPGPRLLGGLSGVVGDVGGKTVSAGQGLTEDWDLAQDSQFSLSRLSSPPGGGSSAGVIGQFPSQRQPTPAREESIGAGAQGPLSSLRVELDLEIKPQCQECTRTWSLVRPDLQGSPAKPLGRLPLTP